jgi:methanogenic corrinoid protein MtbC1
MLLAGDAAGAWDVVEGALRGGAAPSDVYVDLLGPVLRSIGGRWADAELTVADEHRATAAARRLVGRLGPRFTRAGRPRAVVLLGAAAGDHHELPLAMLSDVVRGAGYQVVDLGANTPVESFLEAAEHTTPAAIGISAATEPAIGEARTTVAALRAVARDVPILVGGPAIDQSVAATIGADGWAADARSAVRELDRLLAPTDPPSGDPDPPRRRAR